jgi:hypothetical protein
MEYMFIIFIQRQAGHKIVELTKTVGVILINETTVQNSVGTYTGWKNVSSGLITLKKLIQQHVITSDGQKKLYLIVAY